MPGQDLRGQRAGSQRMTQSNRRTNFHLMIFQKVSEVKIQRKPRMWAALITGKSSAQLPSTSVPLSCLVVLSRSSLSENLISFSSPPLLLPPDYKTPALGKHHHVLRAWAGNTGAQKKKKKWTGWWKGTECTTVQSSKARLTPTPPRGAAPRAQNRKPLMIWGQPEAAIRLTQICRSANLRRPSKHVCQ